MAKQIKFGICRECDSITAWMGSNVRCEECEVGVYEPADRKDLDDAGMEDEEEFEDAD